MSTLVRKRLIFVSMLAIAMATAAYAAPTGGITAYCLIGIGGTTAVNDETGSPLAVGSLLQFINAGANGSIDAVNMADPNYIGGDDSLISSFTVGLGTATDGTFVETIGGQPHGDKVYIRAWNAATITDSTKHGDSATYSIIGGEPEPVPPYWEVPTWGTSQDKPQPTITVTNPNGGNYLRGGQNYNVTWTSDGLPGNVHIEYSVNGGTDWSDVVASTADDGSHSWSVPSENSTQCRVRVSDAADGDPSDTSNSNFTIDSTNPSVTVNTPNGGETLPGGQPYNITWNASDSGGSGLGSTPIRIEYSSNGGSSWTTLVNPTQNDGTHSWNAPNSSTAQGRIRVTATDRSQNSASDISDANFSIQAETVVSNPSIVREGDAPGSAVIISWQTTPPNAAVDIYSKIGAFSKSAADWTLEFTGATSQQTDPNQVGNTIAKYYKVVPEGHALEDADLTSDVLGKLDIHINEGYTLISLPLDPADKTLDSVIGAQLTGGNLSLFADQLLEHTAAGYNTYWLKTPENQWYSGNDPATYEVELGKGYWTNVLSGHGEKDITIVGSVVTAAQQMIDITGGDYTLVGSPYPVNVGLNNSGLFESGASAGNLSIFAAKVQKDTGAGYIDAWLKSPENEWYIGNDPIDSSPDLYELSPGTGYWIYEPNNGYSWNYPNPN